MTLKLNVLCPLCQLPLGLKHNSLVTKPQMEDRLICSVHGDVGSYGEFYPGIVDAARKLTKEKLTKLFRGD